MDLTDKEFKAQLHQLIDIVGYDRAMWLICELLMGGKPEESEAVATKSKTTRPLNSFIAYRSYYTATFFKLQQKHRSQILTFLWKADPFKAQWAILAKAYSLIRDSQGKAASNITRFMEITVPFLNIPDPQVYIRDSGITLEEEPKGVLILKRTKPATWSETGTKMSVFDVVKNAIDCGYVVNFTQELLNQAAGSDMTMAGGSQEVDRTTESVMSGGDLSIGPDDNDYGRLDHWLASNAYDASGIAAVGAVPVPVNKTEHEVYEYEQGGDDERGGDDAMAADEMSAGTVTADMTPSHGQRTSYAPFFQVEDDFPFNSEFANAGASDLDDFDPTEGYEFDAFDITHYMD